MKIVRRISVILATVTAMSLATTANAMPIVGVAVDDFLTPESVGSTVFRSALGGDAIKYYIPLAAGADCTYGVDCGTSSDYGSGGPTMSMNLMFNPVETMVSSTLYVNFEDLDLEDANDPYGFFESVEVFDSNGDTITGLITNINDILLNGTISGNSYTQQLMTVDLGLLTETTYFAQLNFSADYNDYYGNPKNGWNTPEYLIATIEQASVPEPTTIGLLALGLIGIGATRLRRRNA